MKTGKQIGIKVSRAEIRKRKIILVIEPDLLSSEPFAFVNTWSEQRSRPQLQAVNIAIQVKEIDGILTTSAFYAGSQYTKDHSQINSMESCFVEDKDAALNWMKETKFETVESCADKILAQWNDDPAFRMILSGLLKKRKLDHYAERLLAAMKKIEQAGLELQELAKIKNEL